MMALIAPWWRDRTQRERWLIGLMLVLLAGLLAWLLVLRPLTAARRAALAEVAVAEARSSEARRLAAALSAPALSAPALSAASAAPAATAAPVIDVLGRRLAEAGLQPARLEAQGQGQAVLEIAAINGRLLLGWAAALERRDGLVIAELTASRNEDQSVKAHLLVRRAQ